MKAARLLLFTSLALVQGPSPAHANEGAARAAPAAATPGVTDASEYQEIQSGYAAGAYEEALKNLTAFQKRYPESPLLPQARNLQGLIYVLTHKPQQAIAPFRKAIESSQSESFNQFVRYNLATALYESGSIPEAGQVLEETRTELLDEDNRIKVLTLRARVNQKQEKWAAALRDTLDLGKRLATSEQRQALTPSLDQSLQALKEVRELQPIAQENDDSPFADLLLFRLGSLAAKNGQNGTAETTLKALLTRFPQTSRYAEAQDLLRSIQSQAVVEPRKIGVLLPLSGKFAGFGQKALQAVSLAFRIFNSDEADSKVSLVIEDSGEDAETASKALDRLYSRHHVVAVVGPLLSKGVDAVTQKAQELGLPLISLAQQPGTSGDNVFQAGFTPKLQAREIARFAVESRKLKRFAILQPRDRFGEQFTQAFWDAVESLGGEVVGVESYPPGETDFRQAVDKLSGLYYTEARAPELQAMAEQRKELKITRKTRKTEQYFNLRPLVDYDAVFIPDEPKVVGQILPTFAYRDVSGVQFLGINTWNSPELFSRAQNWAVGSLFTEAFYPESNSGMVKRFMARYRQTYDADPGAIEAMAFDAASLLELAISNGAQSRTEMREFLKGVSNYPGVTGRISWKDGAFTRNVSVLTIAKNGQVLAAPQEKPAER